MNTIDFSYDWNNKLHCKAFTTLRLHNPAKFQVGNEYQIELKGERLGTAQIISIKSFTIDKLNDFISYLDTAYNAERCDALIRTMYKNKNINWNTQLLDFILFYYTNTRIKGESR
jgi:hypothetical protein